MDHQSHDSHLKKGYAAVSVQEVDQHGRDQGVHNIDHGNSETKSALAKLNQTWALELGGFLSAFLCLTTTITLLRRYDNELVPDWPLGLNFVLSLLGNIAFAGTLLGVHSALAQSQWIWFSMRPRPLAKLAIFHGSGNALGALRLLFTASTQ